MKGERKIQCDILAVPLDHISFNSLLGHSVEEKVKGRWSSLEARTFIRSLVGGFTIVYQFGVVVFGPIPYFFYSYYCLNTGSERR